MTDRRRRSAVAGAVAIATLAAFVLLHSGARGVALCNERGLGAAETPLSLWPPGARCIGAVDRPDVLAVDPTFLFAIPAVYLVLSLALWLGERRRARTSPERP